MARPKTFDPDSTLDIAVERFWQSGYDGLPIQELCRAMGLNPGSLYGAFGDKRRLFLAAFDRYANTVSRQAIERISDAPSGLDGIRRYFAHLIDSILDGRRRWGCLATNAAVELSARDPEIAARIQVHFQRLETAFASALARAADDGSLPSATADMAAFLVCLVQGLNVVAKTRPSRERLDSIVGVALAALAGRN
jgi:TetR/AcrR family transcriptional repressor of nem operon